VDSTLSYVGGVPGSRIVFTYVHRGVLDGSATFGGTRHVRNTLQRAGETWTFGFSPEHLQVYLAERGLDLIEDVGASEYRARYMGAAARRMKGYEFYRVAFARSRKARESPHTSKQDGADNSHQDEEPALAARYNGRFDANIDSMTMHLHRKKENLSNHAVTVR